MSKSPDKLFCWNFQTEEGGWEKGWGGYSRQTNLHPMDERERNTGGVYIHEDAHRAQIEAAVKRALEGAASSLETRAFREQEAEKEFKEKGKHYKAREAAHFARCLDQLANTHIRALDPAQFIDGEK